MNRYPTITATTLKIGLSILTGKRRSLREDARDFVRRLRPPLQVEGPIPDLAGSGWLVAINHYQSPALRAWWIGLSVTATLNEEIHWVMSTAWTYIDPFRSHLVTPVTELVFRRVADIYGFTSMPPMPPRPWEVDARARAVRQVLQYIETCERPIIGLAPEGADSPSSGLMVPPPGVGRFLALLLQRGLRLLPMGIYEEDGRLQLRLGQPIDSTLPIRGPTEKRDREGADFVMRAIAACLPPRLRGAYS